MWIERRCAGELLALSRAFSAVLVTGPRQVGKTSLLRHLLPDASYRSFDDQALARRAATQPDAFFRDQDEPILLDEVQYVPEIFRELKRRIDLDRRPGRFFLTGSQTFALMHNVSESLAGRAAIIEMSSLGFDEIRAAFPEREDLETLVLGGFPELYANPTMRAGDWYSSYVATYLERDVRNVRGVGDLRDFDRFLRACAVRSGQLLSYSDLARDVGIAPNTAKAWLSVLQASGQLALLEPYHRNPGKRLVKSPKLYFLDTGLMCHLVGIRHRSDLLASPLAGPYWETFVVAQVVRHNQISRNKRPLWFWRTSQGDEVDLLVEQGGRFVAIECKLTEMPGRNDTAGFGKLAAAYGERALVRRFVACRAPHSYAIEDASDVTAGNVLELLKLLEET